MKGGKGMTLHFIDKAKIFRITQSPIISQFIMAHEKYD